MQIRYFWSLKSMSMMTIVVGMALIIASCNSTPTEFPSDNGVYRSEEFQNGNTAKKVSYLRFFKDGRVKEMGSAADSDPEEIWRSLADDISLEIPTATYTQSGKTIEFDMDYRGTMVHYSIKSKNSGKIDVNWKSERVEESFSRTYEFIAVD